MPQQLLSTSIAAPGFYGLNTQESSITLSSGYALEATNCVIDKYGRLGSRQGWVDKTTADTTVDIQNVYETINSSGVSEYLCWGNNKVYSGLAVLSEETPVASATITADNWQAVTLQGRAFLFQRGHDPLVKTSGGSLERIQDLTGAHGTPPKANCVTAAFGRLFAADVVGDKNTVYWTDLDSTYPYGVRWSGGDAGEYDLDKVVGNDSITALAEFNGYLIVFYNNNVVILGDSTPNNLGLDPDALKVIEVIEGVGCIARDSVQHTATDILFLSSSGVRSLSRVIQEKSTPIGNLSANVRDELSDITTLEPVDNIKSLYSEKHAFYLLSFPTNKKIYCFDMRGRLENGAARTTKWSSINHTGMLAASDGSIYFGHSTGIAEYGGYLDDGATYRMLYYTNYFDFDQPTVTKILKSIGITLIGGSGQAFTIKAGVDYSDEYRSYNDSVKQSALSEYGIAEYGLGEFTGGGGTDRLKLSIGGSGSVIQLGFETEISGDEVSIQKFDLYIKQGRTL